MRGVVNVQETVCQYLLSLPKNRTRYNFQYNNGYDKFTTSLYFIKTFCDRYFIIILVSNSSKKLHCVTLHCIVIILIVVFGIQLIFAKEQKIPSFCIFCNFVFFSNDKLVNNSLKHTYLMT